MVKLLCALCAIATLGLSFTGVPFLPAMMGVIGVLAATLED